MAAVPPGLSAAVQDRYRLDRELGQGGMATVYLAEDLKHHRPVALKVLRPELAAALGPDRFVREIELSARLTHPHILPLHDSGNADGFLYYVMPYVEGESLRDRLRRENQLPLEDALRIAREVADALDYAHRQGVIHRDIKPENILLESGHAVVADFGIAKAVRAAGGKALTQTGMSVGTPAYMSPEQAAGEQDLDGRSDLYALACVLYEMLAGEPPYTGPSAQAIVAKKLSEATPRISVVRELVPQAVDQALVKALAKTPADRFATTAQFSEALFTVVPATPADTAASGRRRWLAPAIPAAALLILALAWGLWQGLGGDSETTLDPNLVAIMPFRTAGADPSLAYLREGMMDLLAAKLTGEGGPRADDPRTVLAAWRRVASADDADLSEAQATGVARTIGAGKLLLGSVVGSPGHLVLSATLTSAGATAPTQATVEGPADSLLVMADRLTGQLLAGGTSVRGVHGASLTTSSLDALKAYLDGQVAFRGGQYDVAARHFSRALDADSGFSLAAFFLVRTTGWGATVTDLPRVAEIAWDGRNRLNQIGPGAAGGVHGAAGAGG